MPTEETKQIPDWAQWETSGEGGVRWVENVVLSPFKVRRDVVEAGSLPIEIGFRDATGAPVAAAALHRGQKTSRWSPSEPALAQWQEEAVYGGIMFHHFGHFLLETLARFWFIATRPELPIIWHTRDLELNSWQSDIFRLLGVDSARFRLIAQPTGVARLLLPDPGLQIRRGMWSGHGDALGRVAIGPSRGRRVWLSRSLLRSNPRARPNQTKIINEDVLEAELTRRGWEIVHPERMDIHAQLDALKGAEIIAGIEGSALHTLILCRDIDAEIRIVPRSPNGSVIETYHHIAQAKRFRQTIMPKRLSQLEAAGEQRRFTDIPGLAEALDRPRER